MDRFEWTDAPLSSPQAVGTAAAAYLGLALGLPYVVPKPGLGLRVTTACHNALLCAWSLVMFVGCLYEVVRRTRTEGDVAWMFCENPTTPASGRLFFWSYVYYISKFYELLDTVLVRLNRARMPFPRLHIFHHSGVLLMVWMWLEYSQTLQFIGLLFNTLVHVFMYYYYTQRTLGVHLWWKRYITRLQIVQFLTGFASLAVTLWYMTDRHCAGAWPLAFNLAFNAALLVQFLGVHAQSST